MHSSKSTRVGIKGVLDKYHIHDARLIGELLPETEFIDVTITSPPYWNLKDYGFRKQIGFGQTYSAYLADLRSVFAQVHERTKPSGSLWVISDTFKQNGQLVLLPFDIATQMKEIGWILQDIIIWQKDRTLPWSHQGKLRNIFEYVALYSKSRRFKYDLARVRDVGDLKDYWVRYPERYSPEGKTPSRNWVFAIPRQGSWGGSNNYIKHACPLPPGLVDRILRLTSERGDTVLDPFAGSGSVLATAHAMGRKYIGLDMSTEYASMFSKKVLPAVAREYDSKIAGFDRDRELRRRFGRLVIALRMLKYPKELVRLYRSQKGPFACRAVVALRAGTNRRLLVTFIFDKGSKPPSGFLHDIKEISSRAPLSKYGIQAEFSTLSQGGLPRALEPSGTRPTRRLRLYTNGQFYAWSETKNVSELYASLRNGELAQGDGPRYPPIISNISVHMDADKPEFQPEADDGTDGQRQEKKT